jgi:hypothetical protein
VLHQQKQLQMATAVAADALLCLLPLLLLAVALNRLAARVPAAAAADAVAAG